VLQTAKVIGTIKDARSAPGPRTAWLAREDSQTVMSGRPGLTRVRSGVARKSPGPTDANGGHTR